MLMRRLRRFFRNRTNPVDENVAEKWYRRTTYIYAFCAWNALALTAYMYLKEKKDKKVNPAESKALQTAKMLNLKNVEIYRFSGIGSPDHYTIKDGEVVKPNQEVSSELLSE